MDASFVRQFDHKQIHKETQQESAEMHNETQKETAGMQAATSPQNTPDEVCAQNEMLAYQQNQSPARGASVL
ncbi:hypothetical protein AP219_27635 [Escherichia coli]|nr:hypothetical protein AP219_27635 [Escherichia coli]